jgi:hypothetical protein
MVVDWWMLFLILSGRGTDAHGLRHVLSSTSRTTYLGDPTLQSQECHPWATCSQMETEKDSWKIQSWSLLLSTNKCCSGLSLCVLLVRAPCLGRAERALYPVWVAQRERDFLMSWWFNHTLQASGVHRSGTTGHRPLVRINLLSRVSLD